MYGHDRKVTRIDKLDEPKRVGIYCRVSSYNKDQIHSLLNQISFLTAEAGSNPDFRIVGIYIDVYTGAAATERAEYQRLLADCRAGNVDVVLAKSGSRFGRDAREAFSALQELLDLGVLLLFSAQQFDPNYANNILYQQMDIAFAEEENRTRSRNIAWGIREQAKNGTSALYSRKCYGYKTEDGVLVVVPEEAEVVRLIFSLYLEGKSVLGILSELEKKQIPSPTGKSRWCKRSIDTMLSNEKYVGDVIVLKTYSSGYPDNKRIASCSTEDHQMYMAENAHEAIISREQFAAVQAEKARRSNVTRDDAGAATRKATRYSSKSQSSQE